MMQARTTAAEHLDQLAEENRGAEGPTRSATALPPRREQAQSSPRPGLDLRVVTAPKAALTRQAPEAARTSARDTARHPGAIMSEGRGVFPYGKGTGKEPGSC
jgi:hypothetical protein